jgi:hypothetical protein
MYPSSILTTSWVMLPPQASQRGAGIKGAVSFFVVMLPGYAAIVSIC